jgi:choline dehydrogenase-like flavoprotein
MATQKHYDILIIGSGAGGGTVAARLAPLAEQGAKIALLEAGPHYTREYFTQREIEMMGLFWQGGGWPTKNGAITMAAGKGVGGSTMMYTGVTFRLPDTVVDEWNLPSLTAADLAPRFERLEQELSVTDATPDMVNDNNRLFKEGCDKLGYKVESLQLNLDGCLQYGFCNVGCASGGKQSTLEVQIPEAVRAGVELVANCQVSKVSEGQVQAEVSPAPEGTQPNLWAPGAYDLRAKQIIVAAGSPGTPAILLRSGLGDRFSVLGKYFTLHPALTVYGVYPEVIKNYRGFPKTYFTPEFSHEFQYYIETAFYYPFITTKHLGLWGKELKEIMKAYPRFMTQIILNHDPALESNRVSLDKQGRPVLDYTLATESIASLCHAQVSATRIFFAAGCEKVVMPCADRAVFGKDEVPDRELEEFISVKNFVPNKTPIASAHPQGGCRMGTDPAHSVTDAWGRVHGVKGLYVADGSLFPTSSHVNPYLTIMALADRVAEQVRAEV